MKLIVSTKILQNRKKYHTNMGKLIRHKWKKVEVTHKVKHEICTRCECETYIDDWTGNMIYIDRFGKMRYRTPECVLPNTKL